MIGMNARSWGLPPIMSATAPNVARSCCLCMRERSRTMVHTNVKRRRAMNMGTFKSAVPAALCARLADGQEASDKPLLLSGPLL